MQSIHQELFDQITNASLFTKWNLAKIAMDFLNEKSVYLNESLKLERNSFDSDKEWIYINSLVKFYKAIITTPDIKDWAINHSEYGIYFLKEWIMKNKKSDYNLGSILIKILNLVNELTKNNPCSKMEYVYQIHQLFAIPGQNVSLIDIAYLYSIMDFRELSENSTFPWSNLNTGSIRTPPSSLISMNESFVNCFKGIANNESTEKLNDFSFDEPLRIKLYPEKSPCSKIEFYPQCIEYCKWHKTLFNGWKKEEFLTIMRYALPQRKIILNPILPHEQNLALKLFGSNNLKFLDQKLAPISMALFCSIKYIGFHGEDLGLSEKVCDDFFPSPTDKGICLSRNLNINEIMKRNKYFDTIFDANVQTKPRKILGGPLWSKNTLIIFTDTFNQLRQTYPRISNINIDEISFQLHQSKELGQLHLSGTFNKFTTAFTLKAGNEYYIDVTPNGQISTKNFQELPFLQRKCNLDHEVKNLTILNKKYSINNCKYECHVVLAKKKCQCIPWDFMDDSMMKEECDIFGRTCFFNVMENLAHEFQSNQCNHCFKECDYIKFNKLITKELPLYSSLNGGPGFYGEYLEYDKNMGTLTGNQVLKEFFMDTNNTLADAGLKRVWNHFGTQYGTNYTTKRFDMIQDLIVIHLRFLQPEFNKIDVIQTTMDKFANFGGNFGIFAEITGVSFLGILNFFILLFKILCSSRH